MSTPPLGDRLATWLDELGLGPHLADAGLPTYAWTEVGKAAWTDPGTGGPLAEDQLVDLDRLLHTQGEEPEHAVPVPLLLLARQASLRARLLDEAWLDYDGLAARRGSSVNATRFAVHKAADTHRLLVVATEGRTLVPAFQLDDEGEVRPELLPVLEPLLAAGTDPWRVWAWLTTPAALLGGLVPADAAADPDEADLVRHAAVRLAERGTGSRTAGRQAFATEAPVTPAPLASAPLTSSPATAGPALLTTPITADLVRGAVELEPTAHGLRPHRLPAWARAQVPDGYLVMAQSQPSGVRVALRTAATVLELDVLPTKVAYRGAPPRPDGLYDLRVDGELVARGSADGGHTQLIDIATGEAEVTTGAVGTVRFEGLAAGEKDVEVWLPHTEPTELVAVRSDAPVAPLPERGLPRWVHHGSSISHGSDAESPSTTWPALAAAAGGVELLNLGYGGSALLDPFVARTIRDLPADLVSVKIGINLVNTDVMRLRAFGPAVDGFLDTIREGHPDIPLLVVSPIWCPLHEETPGPARVDTSRMAEGRLGFTAAGDPDDPTRLTLQVVRRELARIVARRAATDPHLALLDGRELYGEADHETLPLPDQLHPDAATHRLIGERFGRLALGPGGPLSPRR